MKFAYFSHSVISANTSSSHHVSNLFSDNEFQIIDISYSDKPGTLHFVSIPKISYFLNRITHGMLGLFLYSKFILRSRRIRTSLNLILAQESIDVFLYYISDLRSMLLAPYIVSILQIPVIILMWDPPEYNYTILKLTNRVQDLVNVRISSALRQASGAIFISQELRDKYIFVPNACITNPTVKTMSTSFYDNRHNNRNIIRIGYAGSGYAHANWKSFLNAIEALHKQPDRTIRIELHYLGRLNENKSLFDNSQVKAIFYGYLQEDEQLRILSKCDLLYLPYWFEKKYEPSITFCFPAKLGVYAAAGVPVLYHGPKSASITRLLEKYQAGLLNFTLEINMLHIIKQYVSRKPILFTGIRKLRSNLLNNQVMQNRLKKFLKTVLANSMEKE